MAVLKKKKETVRTLKAKIRELLANYIASEGCSCCRGSSHDDDEKALGKILNVKKFEDGSGFNFYKYRTKK